MARRWSAAALLVAILALVATMNGGGYQFGASDQAFYIPAVLRHLDPSLFPRDRLLIDSQDRLNVFTSVLAALSRETGLGLPWLFLSGYLVAMVTLFGAVVALGRLLFVSRWTVVAFGAAMTLRHRIPRTGANTFEIYFHPRVLAFAVGAWAIVSLFRGRRVAAGALAALAALIHPTTALWFIVWVGAALMVDAPPRARRWLAGAAALASAIAVWLFALGPLSGRLALMDDRWVALLDAKDYLFPHQWPWWAWLLNLAYPILVWAAYRRRRQAGLAGAPERAVAFGALALAAVLLVAIPLAELRVAVVVQLQVPRVLWMLDLLATAYVVWWIAEGRRTAGLCAEAPSREPPARPALRSTRARSAVATCLLLALAAVSRGAYVKWAEHPERPLVQLDLREDDWRDAMRWLARQPVSVHVLADPGHAWRYGSTVRVAAARDVLLEEIKDLAMALYTRDVATRVAERQAAIGDFAALTPDRARELAAKYGLDYLVIDRPLDLPVAYRNARFWIYSLAPK